MPFDPSGDFTAVTDGLEAVTLRRRLAGTTVAVARGLRRPVGTREAARSDGRYTSDDARWHLPQSEVAVTPQLGDTIADAAGAVWTIVEVANQTLAARWACVCRNLALVYGLDILVNIELAAWDKSDGGGPVAMWEQVAQVRAKIQPEVEAVATRFDAEQVSARFKVYLEENFTFTQDHRLRDSAGNVYRIVEWSAREAIDALQEVTVEKLPWEQPA